MIDKNAPRPFSAIGFRDVPVMATSSRLSVKSRMLIAKDRVKNSGLFEQDGIQIYSVTYIYYIHASTANHV